MSILTKLLGHEAPFDQLFAHHRKVMECVDLARPLVVAACQGKGEEVKRLAEEVFRLEHEADGIKNRIRDHLPASLMLAVARADFLNYLREQDGLADKVEDLASLASMRGLVMPKCWADTTFEEQLLILLDYSLQAVKQVSEMLRQFDELRKRGFSGNIIEHLRQEGGEVGYLEWKVDKQQYKLVQAVLGVDDPSWPFATSYSLLGMIRAVSKIADHAESMGDHLRLMVAD